LPAAVDGPAAVAASSGSYGKLLVLVELKGGNDGLNTLVPYADESYYALRPKIAIARDQVVQLSDRVGLHPSLAPLGALWKDGRLAVLQGVGYPDPNLSHFRSIEIWDTASSSEVYLQDGWLTRAFAAQPVPASFAADGVIIGSNDLGPLAGGGTRAIALANTEQFLRRARLAQPAAGHRNQALAHILKVEGDIVQAAAHLSGRTTFATEFPAGAFGNAIRTAAQIVANPSGVAVVRVTLSGFDTHANQPGTHAQLLTQVANGLVALQAALTELGKWDDTLVLTYAEFGRRPKENQNSGTDHGTASVQLALGGRVTGGLYGAQPDLTRLSAGGNPAHALDFRAVYATVLERWWNVDSRDALGGRFAPLPFVRA
ncbi:MAG: DUF1501 domain-containing protein, partial [Burkholderiales bacterium]|nr:DUF1501 domain-containing protein [Burkholderiales bacterium]